MKVAIYHLILPIDTAEQTEQTLAQMREYSRSRGWTASEYVDRMFFGKESRPEFTRLMKDIKAGKYEGVICLSLDRWANDIKQLIHTLTDIRGREMEFDCLQNAVDINFVGVINNFLKTLRTTKIKVAMAQAKAVGIGIGRKPTPPEQVARVIEVFKQDEKQSVRDIGKKVGLPKSTVFRILSDYRQQGMPEQVSRCTA